MSVSELANCVFALYREGRSIEVVAQHYAVDARWLDVGGSMSARYGRELILAEHLRWLARHRVVSRAVRGPWVCADRFVLEVTSEIAPTASTARRVIRETAIHTVRDARISHVETIAIEVTAPYEHTVALHARTSPLNERAAHEPTRVALV